MRTRLKKRAIWIAVAIIAILLAIQFVFSYENSKTINENLDSRREAQAIKVNTLDIIRSLHELDIGLRGYALIPLEQFAEPFDVAHERIDSVLTKLEVALQNQHYEMTSFYQMKDSVRSYYRTADQMFVFLKQGRKNEFLKFLEMDYGYSTWLQYQEFEKQISSFEDGIINRANRNYQNALSRNYYTIVLLILLIVPTLSYTAYYSNRTYDISDMLIKTTEEKNLLLTNQNEILERLVKERTEEIETQNEEISANLESISKRNEQLEEAKQLIEQKNKIIEGKNIELGLEVKKQTKDLTESNTELIRNINQLEQFSYSVSHNLRAPVARLIGLVGILRHAKNKEEHDSIIQKIAESSKDLDQVLKDLSQTVEIKREINNALTRIVLSNLIERILGLFKDEIKSYQISLDLLLAANELNSVAAYTESILLNLISNAIKYRSEKRILHLGITTYYEGDWIVLKVQDNGLGLDVQRYKRDLFNFYKRFHSHVEGRGLGLFLVKSQVDLLSGTIEVESKVDLGATFTVKLKHNMDQTQ